MNELTVETKNIKPVKFIAILFITYILLSQGNIFMNSVLSPGAKYYNQFFYENLNYIQWLRNALIIPSKWILNAFGYQILSNKDEILIIGGIKLNVNYSCLGLGVMSFIIAYVTAFPVHLRYKWKVALFCCFVVYFLNILRIAGLGIIFTEFHTHRKSLAYHHEVFNILIYIVVLFILFKWISKYVKRPSREKNA